MWVFHSLVLFYTLVNWKTSVIELYITHWFIKKTCVIDLYIVILDLQASPSCIICSDIEFLQIEGEILFYSIICEKGQDFLGYIEQYRVYSLQPASFFGKSSSQV